MVNSITERFQYCNECGMLEVNCICSLIKSFSSEVEFWILTHEREVSRPSNTARLLRLVNPESTKIFTWNRKEPPKTLLKLLQNQDYETYLLFPKDDDLLARNRYIKSDKKIAVIILDGTWKEARKIMNMSEYLNELPVINLKMDSESKYKFRRGAKLGQLCTYEAAMAVLEVIEEEDNAIIAKHNFEIYLKHFEATVYGHEIRG